MARPRVPDTTALVELIRSPRRLRRFARQFAADGTYISVVALTELYVGTRTREDALDLDALYWVARRTNRLITPIEADWRWVGRLVNRWSRLRGAIELGDHLADALIVVSAARVQADVVSANSRHIAVWVELARRAGLDVGLAT